jgi:prepilin-type processing-associated H-X9-DG protein
VTLTDSRSAVDNEAINGAWHLIYGMRAWHSPETTDWEQMKSFTAIDAPSQFYLIADSTRTGDQQTYLIGSSNPNRMTTYMVHLRHNGRANALFADGHVGAKDREYFSTLGKIQGEYGGDAPVFTP